MSQSECAPQNHQTPRRAGLSPARNRSRRATSPHNQNLIRPSFFVHPVAQNYSKLHSYFRAFLPASNDSSKNPRKRPPFIAAQLRVSHAEVHVFHQSNATSVRDRQRPFRHKHRPSAKNGPPLGTLSATPSKFRAVWALLSALSGVRLEAHGLLDAVRPRNYTRKEFTNVSFQ